MVSREQKRAALHEKLQLLRSITNSHALNKTSIIIDASKYIEELKQKVERLNQHVANAQTSSDQNTLPMVTVETLEKGFLINVYSAKTCPGLLVSILESFEEIGLNVLEARVTCTDTFRFHAVGGKNEEQGDEGIDAQTVKQELGQAIKNWSQNADQK
ncbi:hypothetical protein AAZX31_11G238800 [Glycine max]|uniref:Plant bHLH transcription factor ACT-like domain-containing protein n=2 Tax=Glycine subgen. Soja TaxID=1462606 RepID=I1LMX0_SOYBN|nr:uncharacterized protein LOC100814138 isoform X1 [Glycine max]XP_028195583.1 uncharacterized protein LOC114380747 isoform X1 [Glycine soja]KAG4989859.1 hypothetical protein JHK85_032842 [Glycine max]KAG4995446.1 hypothetical protein JHK86_032273 [Glycine max]KAG5125434.1 hypothetical protein JHK82_032171 [Glycine max]KAG5146869.1 hypothetical protein JHK84_032412 [Glycine max]KAH1160495.1 hypothetical protein GYH30_032005 [Glycine max]|eukprot:XP_003538494.1 uncharacterized protein LOC100814138 isoform X1 [Glycine max]